MYEDLIQHFAEKQKHSWCLCPRCGTDAMKKDIATNALSRRTDVYICDICGNVEAIEDMPEAQGKKLSLEKWELMENPEKFFLKGKDYENFYFTFGSWKGFPFRNAYVVVEAWRMDRNDAVQRFRRKFPDKTPGIACYSFDYNEVEWQATEMSNKLPCAGVLHLNGVFEEAE